jgi:hypothetical protein
MVGSPRLTHHHRRQTEWRVLAQSLIGERLALRGSFLHAAAARASRNLVDLAAPVLLATVTALGKAIAAVVSGAVLVPCPWSWLYQKGALVKLPLSKAAMYVL